MDMEYLRKELATATRGMGVLDLQIKLIDVKDADNPEITYRSVITIQLPIGGEVHEVNTFFEEADFDKADLKELKQFLRDTIVMVRKTMWSEEEKALYKALTTE